MTIDAGGVSHTLRERLKGVALDLARRGTTIVASPMESVQTLVESWRVPILVYHQVAESGKDFPWRVNPVMFETQMRWLAENEYRVLSLPAFLDARAKGQVVPRSVVLTFDDGHRGLLVHARDILKRYGLSATLFLATGFMGRPEFPWLRPCLGRDDDPEEYRPLDWDEVRALGSAFHLGSHSVTHPHLATLSIAAMRRELIDSRREIEAEVGVQVDAFAYPGGIARYGDHSALTREALITTGYACGLVGEIGRNGVSSDPFRLRRLSIEAWDSLDTFRAKVVGAFTVVRALQWAGQRSFADPSSY